MNPIQTLRRNLSYIPATILAIFAIGAAANAETKQPNVVFLFADDQRSGTLNLGGKGNPEVITPTLDKLAQRGTLFHNAYVFGADRGSVCYPSRVQLLSGKNQFRYEELDRPSKSRDDMNLPAALRLAGYQTIRTGKANNVPYGINMEFDVNIERANRGSVKGNLGYFEDAQAFLAGKTLKGLDDVEFQWDGESPFFMYIAVGTPHAPFPRDDAAIAQYEGATITPPEDTLVRHPIMNTLIDEKVRPAESTMVDVREDLRQYYASITFMDRLLGELIGTLKKKGLYENTIFVFAGDNGLALGSHGLDGKSNLMEFGGMHVPLLFAGPGIDQGRSDALVYLIDIFPTLSDLCGADKPASLDGRSLAGLLSGKERKVRDTLLTMFTKDAEMRAIRDDRWKLLHFPDHKVFELYDLKNDPRELNDLSQVTKYKKQLERMKKLLASERQRLNDPYPKPAFIKKTFKKDKTPPPGIGTLEN